MSDTLETITDAEWAELAQEGDLSGPELKEKVLRNAQASDALGDAVDEPTTGPLTAHGNCQVTPFSAGIWKIIACKGKISLCGPEDDWSGEIEITFLLADVPVRTVKYHLGKDKSETTDSISLIALRASYTVGVKFDGWCYYIKGSFGYLTFTGWKDHKVNKTLFCFGKV